MSTETQRRGSGMEVRIEGLAFERAGRRVLDIPNLTFAAGRTTALFGPNGAGKTTLLRLVAGLERPTNGEIRFIAGGGGEGAPVARDRARVAYAFQEAVFLRGNVRENLALGLVLRRVPHVERMARIEMVARECGIAHLLERPARRLSGGEAQRVNLARALALRAPVTLLDEPLAGLDRAARAQLLEDLPRLLATFAATTVLVTHDREEAFRIAEALVVLVDGLVRAEGPKGDVFRNPPNRGTAELLGYTVLRLDGGAPVAIPPGCLRLGTGPGAFPVVVERVVDMGSHHHAVASTSDARVDVRLAVGEPVPAPGSRITVVASTMLRLPASAPRA